MQNLKLKWCLLKGEILSCIKSECFIRTAKSLSTFINYKQVRKVNIKKWRQLINSKLISFNFFNKKMVSVLLWEICNYFGAFNYH